MLGTYEHSLKVTYDDEEKLLKVRISVFEEKSLKKGIPEVAKYLKLTAMNNLGYLDVLRRKLGGEWKIKRFSIEVSDNSTKVRSEMLNPTWDHVLKLVKFLIMNMRSAEYSHTIELESEIESSLTFSEEEKKLFEGVLQYR